MSGVRQSLISAIHERRVVHLRYEGSPSPRIVHPHVLDGGLLPGWRRFDLDKIISLATVEEASAVAPGYHPEATKYRHGLVARV